MTSTFGFRTNAASSANRNRNNANMEMSTFVSTAYVATGNRLTPCRMVNGGDRCFEDSRGL